MLDITTIQSNKTNHGRNSRSLVNNKWCT
jgi:hypothetical protein